MVKGYVQIYTGNGKGKTTAALGLSLRAICAGKKVFFGQFIKGMKYSELKASDYLKNFHLKQYGSKKFICDKPAEEDIKKAKIGFSEICNIVKNNNYDVVVLDEINIAVYYNLISVKQVLDLIKIKPQNIELILTGRYAKKEIIDVADLVTEMNDVKHYYNKGVTARTGIEK